VWAPAQASITHASREVIDWIDAHTDSTSVVAYEFDSMLALYTGRRAVPNGYRPVHVWYRRSLPDVEASARLLDEMGVNYVAVRRDVPEASRPIDGLLGRYPGSLRLEYASPGGALIFRTDLDALRRALAGSAPAGAERKRPIRGGKSRGGGR
jgi:hypothetical protein